MNYIYRPFLGYNFINKGGPHTALMYFNTKGLYIFQNNKWSKTEDFTWRVYPLDSSFCDELVLIKMTNGQVGILSSRSGKVESFSIQESPINFVERVTSIENIPIPVKVLRQKCPDYKFDNNLNNIDNSYNLAQGHSSPFILKVGPNYHQIDLKPQIVNPDSSLKYMFEISNSLSNYPVLSSNENNTNINKIIKLNLQKSLLSYRNILEKKDQKIMNNLKREEDMIGVRKIKPGYTLQKYDFRWNKEENNTTPASEEAEIKLVEGHSENIELINGRSFDNMESLSKLISSELKNEYESKNETPSIPEPQFATFNSLFDEPDKIPVEIQEEIKAESRSISNKQSDPNQTLLSKESPEKSKIEDISDTFIDNMRSPRFDLNLDADMTTDERQSPRSPMSVALQNFTLHDYNPVSMDMDTSDMIGSTDQNQISTPVRSIKDYSPDMKEEESPVSKLKSGSIGQFDLESSEGITSPRVKDFVVETPERSSPSRESYTPRSFNSIFNIVPIPHNIDTVKMVEIPGITEKYELLKKYHLPLVKIPLVIAGFKGVSYNSFVKIRSECSEITHQKFYEKLLLDDKIFISFKYKDKYYFTIESSKNKND